MPTVALPGTPTISLAVKDMSPQEIEDGYAYHVSRFVSRRQMMANDNIQFSSGTMFAENVRCKLHLDKNDDLVDVKREQASIALRTVHAAGFTWPSDAVELFVYARAAFSVGWIVSQARVRKALLLIGQSAVSTGTRLVADVVKERFASRGEEFARNMRIRTATFHEIGHAQHELLSPSHYFALSQVPMLVMNILGPGRDRETIEKNKAEAKALFGSSTTGQDLQDFANRTKTLGAKVSAYAGGNPCEFVAEVFSGLMMSVPYDKDVLDTYKAFGGPDVDADAVRPFQGRARSNAVIGQRPIVKPEKVTVDDLTLSIGENLK